MRALTVVQVVATAVLGAAVLLPGCAHAQNGQQRPADAVQFQPIGKIEAATGSFTLTHAEAVVLQANLGPDAGRPKIGDPVFLHDTIQTGADARVGLALNDGTAFKVSPGARIVLDEFVYDPKSKSNSALISLTKGTFTFIAGKVAKTGDMKVQTPVATMGIRGTAPRVQIREDGSVRFSTLVEDYLRHPANGGAAPVERRPIKMRRVLPPDQGPRRAVDEAAAAGMERAIKDQNKALEGKLGICKGC
jgi:hypothetical protein